MKHCEALLIGGSAGSLEVLLKLLPGLKPALSFSIILVLHRKPGKGDILTNLLAARTEMMVKEVEEKEKMLPATLYIAPPNYHLLIENDRTFSLDASEKVNFSRPSIDVTFESAAEVFGENLACLLLSGANSDGTAGLQAVKKSAGLALVQNPSSAVVDFMPQSALAHVNVDAVLNTTEMADYINKMA